MTDLAEYRALVEQVMRDALTGSEGFPRIFENSGEAHARIVLDVMLDNARESICVFSEKLLKSVYDPGHIRAFFARKPGATIRVIIEDPNAPRSAESALVDLKDEINAGRIKLTCLRGATGRHIAIVDSKHVRMETSHPDRKAIVAFGQDEMAARTAKYFEELAKSARPVVAEAAAVPA